MQPGLDPRQASDLWSSYLSLLSSWDYKPIDTSRDFMVSWKLSRVQSLVLSKTCTQNAYSNFVCNSQDFKPKLPQVNK